MNRKLNILVIFLLAAAGKLCSQSITLILNNPSPYISDWQIQANTAILIINNNTAGNLRIKIKAELKDGRGIVVANNNLSKMKILSVPRGISQYKMDEIFPTNALVYKGNLEKHVSRTGRIADDMYSLCVSIVDPNTELPIGSTLTQCPRFRIVAYQAPYLISPGNGEKIPETKTRGILFRWFPVTPSPRIIVTYQLQVFEVLEGQENMTALRTNQPIINKNLKGLLQTQWPIDYMGPDPGRKYIWTIVALDPEGRKIVDGYGMSQPFVFEIEKKAEKVVELILPTPMINPILLRPADGDTIADMAKIVFTWTDSIVLKKDSVELKKEGLWPVRYSITITEIIGNQTPEFAVKNNSAFFVREHIQDTFYTYPEKAFPFEKGKKYAWMVIRQVTHSKASQDTNDINSFSIK